MHEAALVAERQGHNLESFQITKELLVRVSDLIKLFWYHCHDRCCTIQ